MEAARLAAQCCCAKPVTGALGTRVMALCVLFETYILRGRDAVEAEMQILTRKPN